MKRNEILEQFINDPEILYIYECGLQIFGLLDGIEDYDFILITKDNYIPEGFIPLENSKIYSSNKDDGCHFLLYFVEDWFEEVTKGSIIAWECACLPKKYVIKEHVKLLLQTDPLSLRLQYNKLNKEILKSAKDNFDKGNIITCMKELWTLVVYVMFANQIIENHKIKNFKEPADSYRIVVNGLQTDFNNIMSTFEEVITPHLDRFKSYTDGVLDKYRKTKWQRTISYLNSEK